MDREEAIAILQTAREQYSNKCIREAFNMAIESLSKLTCLECEGCGFCDTCPHERS